MKKLMIKFLAACLVSSILPLSVFAADYTVPDYAVTLDASAERIYEGDTVDISFIVNTDDFLMTDMSVNYDTAYFEYGTDNSGVAEFYTPEIKGAGKAGEDGSYILDTKFTFTAKEVTDTVKVDFGIERADIVYSYESAMDNVSPAVNNKSGTSVIIVKRYDVTFADGGTALFTQTVEKGLGDEADTAIQVPAVSYDGHVGEGLEATYYEHIWTYGGNEYTDEEVAAFGQEGSENEITEDTTFVLVVRPQTFDVTAPADSFDTEKTTDKATYGEDYTGKLSSDEYDDKYDYTVKYEIGGDEKEVECEGDEFTIPGEDIIGDMTLSVEKVLNIEIKAHADYLTGHFLITVKGDALGYTCNGNEMYASANHGDLRAWIYTPDSEGLSEAEVEAIAEEFIFTSTVESPCAPATYDLNGSDAVDILDAAIIHGAYTINLKPMDEWIKTYLSADVDGSYCVDVDDYNEVVNKWKGR